MAKKHTEDTVEPTGPGVRQPPPEPYNLPEYPTMVYKGTENTIATDDSQYLALKKAGWTDSPPPS